MNTIYRIPDKVRVINSTTKTPITFRDNNNAVATAATADNLLVEGFGRFKKSEIASATLSRGLTPSLQKWSITAATTTEITVVAPTTPTRVWIEIDIESVSRDFKGSRGEYEFGNKLRLEITARSGETAGTVLAKIYNALFLNTAARVDKNLWIKSGSGTAGAFVDGVATSLTKLELEMADRHDFIKSFKVTGDDYLASTVLTVFAPTQTVAFNKGKNYGFDVEAREKSTINNNWAYGYDSDEIPVADALYTSIYFTYTPAKKLKQDANVNDTTSFLMFLNQNNCEAKIDELADFFNQLSNEVFNGIVSGVYTYGITAAQFKTNA